MPSALNILIVEDNKETLAALSEYFSEKNHSVATASNGLEGLKLLEPDTIIIGITGWGDHPEALASEAKADCVLRKPIDLETLEKNMMKFLSEKRLTKMSHSTT